MQTLPRQTYLDWLRIMAILGVLLYHSARPFIIDDPWHINNAASSDLLSEFNYWLRKPFWNNGQKPVEWLVTSGGVDLMMEEIEKLAQGYPV